MNHALLSNGDRIFDRFHVIQNVDHSAGFSALMTYALNGTQDAIANNWLPVVNFDRENTGNFYDPSRGENVWEYFFEPVAGLSYHRLHELVETGEIDPALVHMHPADEILRRHHSGENRLATFWTEENMADPAGWMSDMRRRGRELVGLHIKPLPHIEAKYRELREQLIGPEPTFGVHIRGTDFAYARVIEPERYFKGIDQRVHDLGITDFKIFLATEQAQFVAVFQERYPGRLVTTDAARSSNDVAPFQMNDIDAYAKGEEVLLDIMLLSGCDYLFKGPAAVGEYAMWFNPELECTDFALESHFESLTPLSRKGAYLQMDIDHKGPTRIWLLTRRREIARLIAAVRRKIGRILRR